MSRYFDALNRLRKGREPTPQPKLRVAGEAEPGRSTPYQGPSAGSGLSFPELQLASRQAFYATLLDLLRASCKGSSPPVVAIAGVSGREPVHEVVAGMELQAQWKGIALRRGHVKLSTAVRTLHVPSLRALGESSSPESPDGRESFRLSGSQGRDLLKRWLADAAAESELLLIETPPVNSSVEAAFLGEACGGLVLVVEELVTERAALEEGIERIRLTGCEILGLVLTGTRPWLPRWIARLVELFDNS